jgi:hypothetical protein
VSIRLKNNFPRKMLVVSALSLSANEVSFSSSLMKTLASPLIVEKNITIHNNPDKISSPTFSSPMENLIIEMVTITNIKREFITYLFLISDLTSFLNILIAELSKGTCIN